MDNMNQFNNNQAPQGEFQQQVPPQYQQPVYYQPQSDMSIGEWVGTLILTCIPLVGFICLIVWAASSSDEKKSRKNWAIAQLIVMAIAVVLSIALTIAFGSIMFRALYY